jgi:single-strand selective monofunctional uracil DNA glycosylase
MAADHPLLQIADRLAQRVDTLSFAPPVTHVYNPLNYARPPHAEYVQRYGQPPCEVLLLGMNPGPFGMAQTGVPFGDVGMVRDWMGIEAPVGKPPVEHPKRPISGFACPRGEVSGRRLWGWARDRCGAPGTFFDRFYVANYCPLVFMGESGSNLTPDKLAKAERPPLYAACDQALRETVEYLKPHWVLGIGAFAAKRATNVLRQTTVHLGQMPHPSPASPAANRGWAPLADKALQKLGIAWD